MSWLADTPTKVINALLAMLPRLRAQESLLAVTRVGLGSGCFDESASRRIRREWARAAADAPKGTRARKSPAELAALGIDVQFVPKKVRP